MEACQSMPEPCSMALPWRISDVIAVRTKGRRRYSAESVALR